MLCIESTSHRMPESQNTAVTNDLTRFEKSVLIAAIGAAKSAQPVKNRKLHSM